MLAEEINHRRIAVVPELIDADEPDLDFESLLTEDLEQIRALYVDDDEKKLRVVPKPDVKEAIGRSPDFGDALVMRMMFFLKLPRINLPGTTAHQYRPSTLPTGPQGTSGPSPSSVVPTRAHTYRPQFKKG